LGDFNYRGINWEMLTSDGEGREFLKTTLELNLTQLVNKPTRGNSILDLVLTSCPESVESISHLGKLGKSNHDILLVKINISSSPPPKSYIRYNFEGLEFILNQSEKEIINDKLLGFM